MKDYEYSVFVRDKAIKVIEGGDISGLCNSRAAKKAGVDKSRLYRDVVECIKEQRARDELKWGSVYEGDGRSFYFPYVKNLHFNYAVAVPEMTDLGAIEECIKEVMRAGYKELEWVPMVSPSSPVYFDYRGATVLPARAWLFMSCGYYRRFMATDTFRLIIPRGLDVPTFSRLINLIAFGNETPGKNDERVEILGELNSFFSPCKSMNDLDRALKYQTRILDDDEKKARECPTGLATPEETAEKLARIAERRRALTEMYMKERDRFAGQLLIEGVV